VTFQAAIDPRREDRYWTLCIGKSMEPPFKKKIVSAPIDRSRNARTRAQFIAIGSLRQKIRKYGPF
jgi:hypothetical protein